MDGGVSAVHSSTLSSGARDYPDPRYHLLVNLWSFDTTMHRSICVAAHILNTGPGTCSML